MDQINPSWAMIQAQGPSGNVLHDLFVLGLLKKLCFTNKKHYHIWTDHKISQTSIVAPLGSTLGL